MTIRGERRKGEVLITVDGAPLGLAVVAGGCGTTRRRDRRGAAAGRDWPRLALAILLAVTDEAPAERFYQTFKWSVIAPI